MPDTRTPETPDVVIGNHCHKYTTGNPAIRFLTMRFLRALHGLLDEVSGATPNARVLEVGCGEGEIAGLLHDRWGDVTALDLPDAGLRRDWAGITGPRFLHADAERLPFPDGHFDVVVAVEVLEHLRNPQRGLAEMARVSRRHLVLSVPREPIFRLGNLATGRHVRAWGNTPGHLNHWGTRAFLRFAGSVGAVRRDVRPLPWTLAWVERGGQD
jgi:ubiquinone/menaquinone biosynthesis C-methylase UbiE